MDGLALVALVKDVGVPAGVAFYVLFRLDKRLGELIDETRGKHAAVMKLLTKLVGVSDDGGGAC